MSALPAAAERPRELWQPDRDAQMAAVETLLASSIPRELRLVLRDFAFDLSIPKRTAS